MIQIYNYNNNVFDQLEMYHEEDSETKIIFKWSNPGLFLTYFVLSAFNGKNVRYKISLITLPTEPQPVWPDLVIFWTLGNFLKPLVTTNLPKSPNILRQFL